MIASHQFGITSKKERPSQHNKEKNETQAYPGEDIPASEWKDLRDHFNNEMKAINDLSKSGKSEEAERLSHQLVEHVGTWLKDHGMVQLEGVKYGYSPSGSPGTTTVIKEADESYYLITISDFALRTQKGEPFFEALLLTILHESFHVVNWRGSSDFYNSAYKRSWGGNPYEHLLINNLVLWGVEKSRIPIPSEDAQKTDVRNWLYALENKYWDQWKELQDYIDRNPDKKPADWDNRKADAQKWHNENNKRIQKVR